MNISFYGAVGTVTGSRYLIESNGTKVLVDCGLFQGFKNLRLRNRREFPVPPESIDAVVLTHAHIDHSGYFPKLVKDGFKGPLYCTFGTTDLCKVLLPDCGHIQTEEAKHANKHKYSRHNPAVPLYTYEDALVALEQFVSGPFHQEVNLGGNLRASFFPGGHILGASFVRISDGTTTITFSGDVGRPHDLVMNAPEPLPETDYLVLESTYGNRLHPREDVDTLLADVVNKTVSRGGVVVVPSFAVGRTQTLLYLLYRLKQKGVIGSSLPVYLDSPMATTVTHLYHRYQSEHRLSPADAEGAATVARYVRTPEESKELDRNPRPMVLISASGMVTGGRVLHHVRTFGPDPRNTILFTGYQAPGTRGETIREGASQVKMFGEYIPIRADVASIDALSAHADYRELIDWVSRLKHPPRRTFITHGEPAAADALRLRIQEELQWQCEVPEYRDRIPLAAAQPSPT